MMLDCGIEINDYTPQNVKTLIRQAEVTRQCRREWTRAIETLTTTDVHCRAFTDKNFPLLVLREKFRQGCFPVRPPDQQVRELYDSLRSLCKQVIGDQLPALGQLATFFKIYPHLKGLVGRITLLYYSPRTAPSLEPMTTSTTCIVS